MKRVIVAAIVTGLFWTASARSELRADDLATTLKTLHGQQQGRVVAVDYTARMTLEGLPGINAKDNERTLRGTVTGIIVSRGEGEKKALFALVSSTAIAPDSKIFQVLGATPKMKLLQLAVRTAGGVKLPAELAAVNGRLGLALLRLDRGGDVLKPVSFPAKDKTPEASVGQQLAVVSTGSQLLGSPRLIELSRVAGKTTKPRSLVLLSPARPAANGALVLDLKGQVVGIHAALPLRRLPDSKGQVGRRVFDSEEVAAAARGYMIPVADVKAWFESVKLKDKDKVQLDSTVEVWLGVESQVITEELAAALNIDYSGVARVKKIYKGTPAEKAGLKKGDLILQIDGEALEMGDDEQFRDLVADLGLNAEIELTVLRADKRLKLKATLVQSPPSPTSVARFPAYAHGFVIRDRCFFDQELPEGVKGVVVAQVAARGQARLAGVKVGDLVTHMDGQAVTSVEEAQSLIQSSRSLEVTIQRPGAKKPQKLRIQVR